MIAQAISAFRVAPGSGVFMSDSPTRMMLMPADWRRWMSSLEVMPDSETSRVVSGMRVDMRREWLRSVVMVVRSRLLMPRSVWAWSGKERCGWMRK